MIETIDQIGGRTLKSGESFSFACGPQLDCFNSCCRNKRLPLWPYDMLRLRRGLKASSEMILADHAELDFDPVSGWPALRLKLDDEGWCPFVGPDGCGVYAHRPAACRIYPLARAVSPPKKGQPAQAVYIMQETKGCHGWNQECLHNVDSWTDDQEIELYNRFNDRLLPLLFHPQRRHKLELTPQQTHAFVASLYNLDTFRKMMENPVLKDRFGNDRVNAALETDEDLLLFGVTFLVDSFFGPSPS